MINKKNSWLNSEFDRQIETLLEKGYPKAGNIAEKDLSEQVKSLKVKLQTVSVNPVTSSLRSGHFHGHSVMNTHSSLGLHLEHSGYGVNEIDLEKGYLPFVVVIKNQLVATEKSMALVKRDGRAGVVKLNPLVPKDFETIGSVQIPNNLMYLMIDIDRGKKTLNVTPYEAMKRITVENRSPVTIDEGVAIITHFPDFLMKNNCFSLLASRHTGDKRVPAIWINGAKHPNLGWCWENNPHTWLGSASCKYRVG